MTLKSEVAFFQVLLGASKPLLSLAEARNFPEIRVSGRLARGAAKELGGAAGALQAWPALFLRVPFGLKRGAKTKTS